MSKQIFTTIIDDASKCYSSKLQSHGTTPSGVDWSGLCSQYLRFEQLTKIIPTTKSSSIIDLGCGYGALYDYLINKFLVSSYLGIDISEEMINSARRRFPNIDKVRFIATSDLREERDFCLASGIFNVRLKHTNNDWYNYIKATLDVMHESSRVGFSFNCMTSYSDQDKMKDYLYYADPCQIFDLCKKRYSHNVALLHDYNLYEFTILVRKNLI